MTGWSLISHGHSPHFLFDSEYPDDTTFGYLGVLAGKHPVETGLHPTGIHPPTRLHGNILLARDLE